jgi:hypothetical protein
MIALAVFLSLMQARAREGAEVGNRASGFPVRMKLDDRCAAELK